ncbi:MAG TPA: hypothetical protein VGB62_03570 [Allosphingosinicella sp.]|jgi:hypothetical protein
MNHYRLYGLNAAGGFFRCDEISAESDEAAIAEAVHLRREHAAELWEQGRMVQSFAATVREPAE